MKEKMPPLKVDEEIVLKILETEDAAAMFDLIEKIVHIIENCFHG
jgi:hypothetical protein